MTAVTEAQTGCTPAGRSPHRTASGAPWAGEAPVPRHQSLDRRLPPPLRGPSPPARARAPVQRVELLKASHEAGTEDAPHHASIRTRRRSYRELEDARNRASVQ